MRQGGLILLRKAVATRLGVVVDNHAGLGVLHTRRRGQRNHRLHPNTRYSKEWKTAVRFERVLISSIVIGSSAGHCAWHTALDTAVRRQWS